MVQKICPYCAKRLLHIDILRRVAKERGGTCLSKKFLGARAYHKFRCKFGHVWEVLASHVVNSGSWCKECAGHVVKIRQVREFIKARGGNLLSKEYVNARNKLDIACANNHEFQINWNSLSSKGSWCRYCSQSYSERICRVFMESIFGEEFPSGSPDWLVNREGARLYFDGFCEKLKVAFEHHGRQHFCKVKHFDKRSDLGHRLNNDQSKRKKSKENSVLLIEIPPLFEELPVTELRAHILNAAREARFTGRLHNTTSDPNWISAYIGTELANLKNTAKARNGKLLSDKWHGVSAKYDFLCAQGHKFSVQYNRLVGTTDRPPQWCYECELKRRSIAMRDPIEKFQEVASSRGGKLITTDYVNQQTLMIWECARGHKWPATASNVIGNASKKGTWCRKCRVRY